VRRRTGKREAQWALVRLVTGITFDVESHIYPNIRPSGWHTKGAFALDTETRERYLLLQSLLTFIRLNIRFGPQGPVRSIKRRSKATSSGQTS
jgi:hypothetical protein